MDDQYEKPYLVIVDDDVNFSKSLRLALEDTYEISLIHSIEAAKRSFRKKLPELSLIDLNLPDGNGVDLFRELKRYNDTPVIFLMTACATAEMPSRH
ncbi:MAG TPA: response regulator [Syntrophales bacterium]|nr:response regulator [Syntrophales bacterium]